MERIGTAVIGGGAVGCAVAYELARNGMKNIFLLERMPRVGEIQSARNSGVIHAGIYYDAKSQKAELCVEANPLMYEFCSSHGVANENVGKLVVAATDNELTALEAVYSQAKTNGVPGIRMLTRQEVKTFEPNVDVPAAILVPTTGIVDAAAYTAALADRAREFGANVLTNFEVIRVSPSPNGIELVSRRGGRIESFTADMVVNAAGLWCDIVGRMIDPELDIEVIPLRGEYYKLNRRSRPELWLERMNVYPVPARLDLGGEIAQMVGVHLTPTFALGRNGERAIGNTVTVGPEFAIAQGREDYEANRKPREFFFNHTKRFFPGLRVDDLAIDFTGIMVRLRGTNDFVITKDRRFSNCIQLLGIGSPGLTCSLAIARRVHRLLTR